jgi:hypothetical protein
MSENVALNVVHDDNGEGSMTLGDPGNPMEVDDAAFVGWVRDCDEKNRKVLRKMLQEMVSTVGPDDPPAGLSA